MDDVQNKERRTGMDNAQTEIGEHEWTMPRSKEENRNGQRSELREKNRSGQYSQPGQEDMRGQHLDPGQEGSNGNAQNQDRIGLVKLRSMKREDRRLQDPNTQTLNASK